MLYLPFERLDRIPCYLPMEALSSLRLDAQQVCQSNALFHTLLTAQV